MKRLIGAVVLVLFSGCWSNDLKNWNKNEFQCANCQMGIVDFRFRAVVVTEKGKTIPFDSVECLLGWIQTNTGKYRMLFSDFKKPENWISFHKIYLLRSAKRQSPMGGGFSVYSSLELLNQAKQEVSGMRIMVNIQ